MKIYFIFLILLCPFVDAYGIAVSPAEINQTIDTGSVYKKYIYIFNPNALDYKIDDNLPHWMNLTYIEEGKYDRYLLYMNPHDTKPGSYEYSIMAYPNKDKKDFSLISGSKIKVNVKIMDHFSPIRFFIKKNSLGIMTMLSMVLLGIVIFLLFR